MNKQILRELITSFKANQPLEVQMRGMNSSESFLVVSTRKGKGRTHSLIATLKSPGTDSHLLEISTAKNMDILNISIDGQLFGVTSELDEPFVYPVDNTNSGVLLEAFSLLLPTPTDDQPTQQPMTNPVPNVIKVSSTNPWFNDTFRVLGAKRVSGKPRQVRLSLQSDKHTHVIELWSHRHSGVIQNVQVLVTSGVTTPAS